MNAVCIRQEQSGDEQAIGELTERAFRGRPYAGGDEQDVIDRLRACGALSLSLVAVDAEQLIGQISFSPAENTDGSQPWFALGPVAVIPERQGQGIGAKLIEEGVNQIARAGALGCILTGDPNYYQRFDFGPEPDLCPLVEPAEYFMLRRISGPRPTGRFAFHKAFYGEV